MKTIRILFAAVIAALLFVYSTSCSDNDGPVTEDIFTMKFREGSTVNSSAGSMFIIVETERAWTLSLDFDDLEPWAQLGQTQGTGSKYLSLMWFKNTGTIDRNVTVSLVSVPESETARPDTVKLVFTQTCAEHDNTGSDIVSTDVPVWMELPAVTKSVEYIAHSFTLNNKVYRNYSMGWNQDALVADWVAYPLSSIYTSGSVGRTDQWAYDPYLGSQRSPAPFGGYCGSYDRGHQLPSQDRQCNDQANAQTFYGSNMTPQLADFNQGIWARLEGKVRTWAANSDTLYVVTGCVTSNSTMTSPDSDGKPVKVPTAYYKVILRYVNPANTTIGFSGYMGCAIWMDHKSYGSEGISSSFAMSIDSIEKKLGMDFFPNLVAAIGEGDASKVESQDPKTVSWWW